MDRSPHITSETSVRPISSELIMVTLFDTKQKHYLIQANPNWLQLTRFGNPVFPNERFFVLPVFISQISGCSTVDWDFFISHLALPFYNLYLFTTQTLQCLTPTGVAMAARLTITTNKALVQMLRVTFFCWQPTTSESAYTGLYRPANDPRTANDPQIGPQMIPGPEMIPRLYRKWSPERK